MLKNVPYTEDEIEEVPCIVCGDTRVRPMYEEQGLSAGRCQACSLVYTNRRAKMAQSHFWDPVETIRERWAPELADPTVYTRYGSFLDILRRLKQIHPSGNFLEVGAYCGLFQHAARAAAPWKLHAIEPGEGAASLLRERFGKAVDLHVGFVHDAPWPDSTFHCIALTDVFEHIPDPNEFLGKLRRLLRPDGVIYIKTPNERWTTAKNFVARKVLRLDLGQFPLTVIREHIVHYSQPTFAAVMRRNGLRVRHWVLEHPIYDKYSYSKKLWKRAIRSALFYSGAGFYMISGRISWPVMHLSAIVERDPDFARP